MQWLQTLDTSLFRLINQSLSNPVFDVVMPWFSGNRLFVPLALLAAVIFIWRGRAQALICVLMIVAASGVSDGVLCNTIKKAVGRPRPFVTLSDVRRPAGQAKDNALPGDPMRGAEQTFSQRGYTSLPSAHAANWFAATMVMFLYRRRSLRFMLPLAIVVSFSRVYNGVHYPGDVLAGALLGAGAGVAVVFALNAAWRRVGKKWFPLWLNQMPSLVLPEPREKLKTASIPQTAASTRNAATTNLQSPMAKSQQSIADPQSQIANRKSQIEQHWLRVGYVLIVVLLLARWAYLASGAIELSEDEAYQWLWSKHLALSYFSKPPLIAYTQFLGTSLWGDNAFGVRFFSPVIAAIIGLLMLRFFAREVSARAGFFLVLTLTTTPLLAAGATLMTVDPLSVLFWTATMLAGWRAIQEDSTITSWLWVGLWMGLGFLSKYTELFQCLCWAVFFALWPPARKQLRRPGPYLALLVIGLCALPVLIWNAQNGWPTVAHVIQDNANLDKPWHPTLRFFFEFIGAEFGLLNPVFFIGTVAASVALWRRYRDDLRLVYFFSMGAPLFFAYLLFTFHSRVQLNWIAPAVLPLLCVMVIYWEARAEEGRRFVKRWFIAGLAVGLGFVTLAHETKLIEKLAGRPLPPSLDPLRRVRGWDDMAKAVGQARTKLLAEGKPVFIIGNHYGVTSLVAFYLPDARARVKDDPLVYCRSYEQPRNQFFFWPGYVHHREGQNAIFVRELSTPELVDGWFWKWVSGEKPLQREARSEPAPAWLLQEFDSVTDLGLREVLYRGQVFHTLQLFECTNLR